MRLFSAEQMREADKAAAEAGVPTLLLIESAGREVAEAASRHWPMVENVLVLCGTGNNGGDGYVAARHLQAAGKRVTVLELNSEAAELGSDDALSARAAWLAQERDMTRPLNTYTVGHALAEADLVIDALFGSGLSRALEGEVARIVLRVNEATLPILSVDLPSGVSADSPEVGGPHIRAARTVQLAGAKRSSVFSPARDTYGVWEIADIGIPQAILTAQSDIVLLDDETVRPWLPQRARGAHKYTVGTVLVIAGSSRYQGAAELACRGAYRAGAGLVTLVSEERLAGGWPEIIFEKLEWKRRPLEILRGIDAKRAAARVIGPGLDTEAGPHLPKLIRGSKAPTVLDALALVGDDLWASAVRRQGRCLLTPHVGEAARLLGVASEEVSADPIGSAWQLAETFGAIAVLKGSSTVLAAPDGRVAVSAQGHPGMATGGTGDVLAGMLGAFLASEGDLFGRACAAVYLHGKAGEQAAGRYGYGLVASDLLEAFPSAWLKLGS